MLVFFVSHIYGRLPALPEQTAFLQTDRSCYVSGDLILLNLVHLQTDTNSSIEESVMYVDIVDRDSQFVTGEIFKLDQGIASGFLKIPDAVKTGYYLIRAYTYKSKNSIGQTILDCKLVFVTNRFNQTFENYEGDYSFSELNSDRLHLQDETKNYSLKLADTNSQQQSKVTDTIQVDINSTLNESVIAVDIVDRDSQFVAGEISKFDQGIASGFMQIPDTVKNGLFLIRAYNDRSKMQVQKKLDSKQVLATDHPNQTSTNYAADSISPELYRTRNVLHKEPSKDHIIMLADTIFNKRSKVTGSIKFDFDDLNDTAWLALSVKPVSVCESQLAILNEHLIHNENIQDKSYQQDGTLGENKGMIISGHVTDSITGKPLSNLLVFMAYEDSLIRLESCITNTKGKFKFLVTDSYEKEDVYMSVYSYPKLIIQPQTKITLDSKFLDNDTSLVQPKKKVGVQNSIDSLNVLKSIVSIAYEIHLADEQEKSKPGNVLFKHQSLGGDMRQTVVLDDYVELPDLIQIVRELMHSVRLEKEEKGYVFSVIDGDGYIIRKNPLVFVDGVPLTDITSLINWGSDKIEMIQVQNKPRYFGNVPFENGMIFIWTKKMDFWSNTGVKYTHTFTLPCFQKPNRLNFRDYSKEKNKSLPDFRQILFWEPSIMIENNEPFRFCFYTSDEVGVFEVLLKGINKSKQSVIIRKYIRVK